jgi:hypothetical protein
VVGRRGRAKFAAPTVEYPSVGFAVARDDLDHGELLIGA